VLTLKTRSLNKFRLCLNDKTLILHDVKVFNSDHGIQIASNPLLIWIRPVKIIGVSAFDEYGFIGRVARLPRFMWRMLQSNHRLNHRELKSPKISISMQK
jgi:hypothetical protein